MKLIKINQHYHLLSSDEPQLFDTVICPVIKDNYWDGHTFEVCMLNSDLMPLLKTEFSAVKTVSASTMIIDGIPVINRLDLINLGIENDTESEVEKYADDFCKSHLPHVDTIGHYIGFFKGWEKHSELNGDKKYTYKDMVSLVSHLMDYTKESHSILGFDEREAHEFVDIFINTIPKPKVEWEVIVETHDSQLSVDENRYIKILRITKEKFTIWDTYDNWKEKNANRLSRDYDELVKQGYGKSYNFYCCGRWDENEL